MVWGWLIVCEYFILPWHVMSSTPSQRSSQPWSVLLWVVCIVSRENEWKDSIMIAEVCSAHPTSGGPYFWAAMLSEPKDAAFASWVTGWFNLLGQVAVTTGIRYDPTNFQGSSVTHAHYQLRGSELHLNAGHIQHRLRSRASYHYRYLRGCAYLPGSHQHLRRASAQVHQQRLCMVARRRND